MENESIRFQKPEAVAAQPALIPLAAIVEQGGGVFVGVQAGYPELGIEPMALFQAPSRSTLALPLSELTPENVFQKILESAAKFAPKAVAA